MHLCLINTDAIFAGNDSLRRYNDSLASQITDDPPIKQPLALGTRWLHTVPVYTTDIN